jgi:hypothetical protein
MMTEERLPFELEPVLTLGVRHRQHRDVHLEQLAKERRLEAERRQAGERMRSRPRTVRAVDQNEQPLPR